MLALVDGLTWCTTCRKVIGPHGGWHGAECQCGHPPADALRGAHSIRSRRT